MLRMDFDFGILVWIIIVIISVLSNAAEKKKQETLKKRRAQKRPKTPPLTPAELVQKRRQIKEKQKRTQPATIGDLFEQIFENNTQEHVEPEKVKKQQLKGKETVHKPERLHESKYPRKAKRQPVSAAEVTKEPETAYSFTVHDLHRAIITKEIIDKPKALRNDSFY